MLKQVRNASRVHKRDDMQILWHRAPQAMCSAYGKKCSGCRKQNHFKAICTLMQQQHDWHGGKIIHDVGQEDDLHIGEPDEQDRSFDSVRVKYINLDSIKSYIYKI